MTTLEAIGVNLAASLGLGVASLMAFGVVVYNQSEYVAPRCAARPKKVIFDADSLGTGNALDRGNPWTGWIPWTLKLSYDQILSGIPGTGTRDGGRTGLLLKSNLDSIVLLRFHALGLKVSALATVLFLVFLLPMFWTGGCHENLGTSTDWQTACVNKTGGLTNYERTTIANVPALSLVSGPNPAEILTDYEQESTIRLYFTVLICWIVQGYLVYLLKREWIEVLALRRVYYLEANVWGDRKQELAGIDLFQESFRRIRQNMDSRCGSGGGGGGDNEDEEEAAFKIPVRKRTASSALILDEDTARLERRDPWIPHPEHRDTVPPIQLYSVMVGGLPSLPEQEEEDAAAALRHRRQTMDWQLALTAAFFDHCVPNQPGFSSSVAAVTILPSSKAVATAWRKWYKAAKKLRRLRFIRSQIAKRYHDEMILRVGSSSHGRVPSALLSGQRQRDVPLNIAKNTSFEDAKQGEEEGGGVMAENDRASLAANGVSEDNNTNESFQDPLTREEDLLVESHGEEEVKTLDLENPLGADAGADADADAALLFMPQTSLPISSSPVAESSIDDEGTSQSTQQFKEYYEQILSSRAHDVVLPVPLNVESEDNDPDLSDNNAAASTTSQQEARIMDRFGPEQMAIYSREFAQSAAPCCPNGCCERIVTNASLDELIAMEREAAEEVLEANAELWKIQQRAKELATPEIVEPPNKEYDNPEDDTSDPPLGEEDEEFPEIHEVVPSSDIETPQTTNSKSGSLRERRSGARLPRGDSGAVHFRDDRNQKQEPSRTHRRGDSGTINQMMLDPFGSLHSKLTNWEKVQSIVSNAHKDANGKSRRYKRKPITGVWKFPTLEDLLGLTKDTAQDTTKFVASETMGLIDLSRESTYAVVTFTSRQAAAAARQCLADARSAERWILMQGLPIPPLADAAACDLLACRNCCRPVTLSIDDRQKHQRHFIVMAFLGAFYLFTPFVLALFSSFLSPQALEKTLPRLFQWFEDYFGTGTTASISGFLQSILYTSFFVLCPTLFKTLANFGSNAHSVANAELSALQYFWWYMVISAFSGALIANMVLYAFNNGISGGDVSSVLLAIAQSIPSIQAPSWLNWIVLRTAFILTSQYLLQVPAFLWALVGCKCCSRLALGGGPGPPAPYRLYVDSGVVLLSLLGLAPSSPLVAPAAFFYFLYAQPVLRRCVIFVYRPRFDSGGLRWPFLFTLSIASLLVGQILLTLQMVLKQAAGPGVLAALPSLFTLFHYRDMNEKFSRPFLDAALLQTSLLDGWDETKETTMEKREDFRKFLVDSHKAAYVPVCLAGADSSTNSFTAEPAVVVPLESDLVRDLLLEREQLGDEEQGGAGRQRVSSRDLTRASYNSDQGAAPGGIGNTQQFGAVLRRAVNTLSVMNRIAKTSETNQHTTNPMASLAEEDDPRTDIKCEPRSDYFAE